MSKTIKDLSREVCEASEPFDSLPEITSEMAEIAEQESLSGTASSRQSEIRSPKGMWLVVENYYEGVNWKPVPVASSADYALRVFYVLFDDKILEIQEWRGTWTARSTTAGEDPADYDAEDGNTPAEAICNLIVWLLNIHP